MVKAPFSRTTAAGAESMLATIEPMKNSVKTRLHSGFYSTSGRDFSKEPDPISYSTKILDFLNPTDIRSQFQTVAVIGRLQLNPFSVNI